jgi:hypothetical protein
MRVPVQREAGLQHALALRFAASLIALLLLSLTGGVAEAQARGRGRAAAQLRQAPPEDPDEPSSGLSAPTGTLGTAFTFERQSSQDGRAASGEVSNTTVLGVRFGLPAGFAIHTTLHLEPVQDQTADQGRYAGHAAWVETLNLRWQSGPVLLFGGKIHPRFGAAWYRVPGLYGADFAGDYELHEKLGAGAEIDLEDVFGFAPALGGHEFRVEAFQADTSFLSSGLLHPRWAQVAQGTDLTTGEGTFLTLWRRRDSRALGGADNASGVAGLTTSLVGTGIDLPGDAGLGYSVAFSLRAPGSDATAVGRGRRERGATAALFGAFGLPFDFRFLPLVEVTHQDAAGGYAGNRADWLTAVATLRRGAVAVSLVEMRRRVVDEQTGRSFAHERAVHLTLDLGALSGIALLSPVSLSFDERRVTAGGRRADDVAAGVLVNLPF